ncbi:MAG: type VI secretion system tip protein VgrG, partial [Myxococcales bacterium]|nr:type VI secretion system tip protein VgrG [Myxococcales bacterium]
MSRELSKTTLVAGALIGDAPVVRYRGRERMNGCYRYEVDVALPSGSPVLELLHAGVLGQEATFTMAEVGYARAVHGFVSAVGNGRPLDAETTQVSVEITPRLALLGLRTHSRIFQDKTGPEVIKLVLDDWGVSYRADLVGSYDHRPYVTQYKETDLAFVERLLSEEGIATYFDQSGDSEVLVMLDAPTSYLPIGPRHYRGFAGGMAEDEIASFEVERRLRPTAARLGDFDFRRPLLQLRALEVVKEEPAGVFQRFGTEKFARYFHGDIAERARPTELEVDPVQARTVLDQMRADGVVGRGVAHSRQLAPGLAFTLDGHPVASNNRGFAVTAVEIEGTIPFHGGDAKETASTTFECVPDDVVLRPPFIAQALRQVTETATVVGPGTEEIWVDEHARVQVVFHWDLEPKGAEGNMCWLRVSQPWAGANWGAQLIPRVGMEVIVSFLGGDPDRPIITGCVYNGTHPTPFQLPKDKTKSGLRTQTTPKGPGFNELSFEDKVGEELVYIKAEKDLDQEVKHDRSASIGNDDTTDITRIKTLNVGLNHVVNVAVDEKVKVGKDRHLSIGGDSQLSVGKRADVDVNGGVNARIEGDLAQKGAGELRLDVNKDIRTTALGHMVTVVGAHDNKTSAVLHVEGTTSVSSSGPTLISSPEGLEIVVGDSVIRMTKESIELSAKNIFLTNEKLVVDSSKDVLVYAEKRIIQKTEKLKLEGESSKLELKTDAKLDGTKVMINCKQE